jgi:glutathione S-transferase
VTFNVPKQTFDQDTPLGKLPVIEDGGVTICESGAIVEYIVERYGNGRLAPAIGSPLRGPYLQWIHFAESTAFAPLGVIVWHVLYQQDSAAVPGAIAGAHTRAHSAFAFIERGLDGKDHLLGAEFSAADVMMGFTLIAARMLGVLDDRYPNITRYVARLEARPAFRAAAEL